MSALVAVVVALAAVAVAVRAGRRAERAELGADEVGARPRGWVSRPAHAERWSRWRLTTRVSRTAVTACSSGIAGVMAAQNVSVMVCDGADTAPIGIRAYEFQPDDVTIEAGDQAVFSIDVDMAVGV